MVYILVFFIVLMFTEILKEEKLNEIIELLKKENKDSANTKIASMVNRIILKNNEFAQELARDKTILNFCKIRKLRTRAQKGNNQLNEFNSRLVKEIVSGEKTLRLRFHKPVVEMLNNFEDYITRLKERETALLEVFASFGSLIVALLAIGISLWLSIKS